VEVAVEVFTRKLEAWIRSGPSKVTREARASALRAPLEAMRTGAVTPMVPEMVPAIWEQARRMERGTAHQEIDKSSSCGAAGLRRAMILALLALALCLSQPFSKYVAAAEDNLLQQSGIRYPEGYDVNTVGEIQGKAHGFVQPDKGPAHFTLSSRRDTYTVFLSPGWYWNDLKTTFKDGEELLVVGSKTLGKDGNLYIIAQEVRITGSNKTLVLRGVDGSPLWRPLGSGSGGGQGGFGSPGGGRGGVGGSAGGAGRGRR
jgi:hypothetical protein